MSGDYLWDGSGRPDPEVQRLEQLLRPEGFSSGTRGAPRPGPRLRRGLMLLAAAAAIALASLATWRAVRDDSAWRVVTLAGDPHVRGASGGLRIGGTVQTDARSRARVAVGDLGHVELAPDTILRRVAPLAGESRLRLERGRIDALTVAPPRELFVDTPGGTAVDLGCVFTLETDEQGRGLLTVDAGWVAFERDGREAIVPSGGACEFRPPAGPGTPHRQRADARFRAALARVDFGPPSERALDVVLASAERQDALSLVYLLPRVGESDRERVLARAAQLSPPPRGVSLDELRRLDARALERWRDALWGAR